MTRRGHEAVRTCVACRQEGLKTGLIRVVRSPEGSAAVDLTGRAAGRGAYVHRSPACIESARKRRQIERALGASASLEFWGSLTLPE
jgi:uncharacterized protein